MNSTDDQTGSSRRFREGLSWDHPSKPALLSVAVGLLLVTSLLPTRAPGAGAQMLVVDADHQLTTMIVRERHGSGDAPELAVARLGGEVGRHIGILDAFVAQVPEQAVATLAQTPGVAAITPDAEVHLLDDDDDFDAEDDLGSMYTVAQRVTGAGEYWNDGWTGKGVDVAVIDSGVVPVNGLTTTGKVLNGADLSFESQSDALRHLDTYGHGTHMAGIIAGRDDAVSATVQKGNSSDFIGMAPGARIVSIKVADNEGATDVSQVIAAIDWVVAHRRDDGMNIRVLNLSFGTDGVQDYLLDPLAYAAEVAWRKGIVVVVAAGNRGYGTIKLNNPAYNPHVLAVGATASNGTYAVADDTIPSFSSCGNGQRNPDLVAPGKSIVSLRTPNSTADIEHPEGRVGSRFFRGSGTSQAAAVVSGAAALVIQQRPTITPDQVKALLTSTATPLPEAGDACQGAGLLNLKTARGRRTPSSSGSAQQWPRSTGLGSLDAARGSERLSDDTDVLDGERDIFGTAWDATAWARASLNEDSWSSNDDDDDDDDDDRVAGGMWNGKSWSGDAWSGSSWSGTSWSGKSWSDAAWSGKSWSDAAWSGKSWSDATWTGKSWSGKSWSGSGWTVNGWSASTWQ